MSIATALPAPPFIGLPTGSRVSSFRRFTVPEYHKLVEIGILAGQLLANIPVDDLLP